MTDCSSGMVKSNVNFGGIKMMQTWYFTPVCLIIAHSVNQIFILSLSTDIVQLTEKVYCVLIVH